MKTKLLFISLFIALFVIPSFSLFAQKKKRAKWERKRINAWVITTKLDTFEGQLLMADSSKLKLWASKDPYSSKREDVTIVTFTPEEIKQVITRRKGYVGKRVALVAFSGAALAGTSFAINETQRFYGNGNVKRAGIIGGIRGYVIGAALGLYWGLRTMRRKTLQLEGDKAMFHQKLKHLKSRSLLYNDWGTEHYWIRNE